MYDMDRRFEDQYPTSEEAYPDEDKYMDDWDEDMSDAVLAARLDEDHEPDPFHGNDVEADADALASIGWGTDEDYGYSPQEDY